MQLDEQAQHAHALVQHFLYCPPEHETASARGTRTVDALPDVANGVASSAEEGVVPNAENATRTTRTWAIIFSCGALALGTLTLSSAEAHNQRKGPNLLLLYFETLSVPILRSRVAALEGRETPGLAKSGDGVMWGTASE